MDYYEYTATAPERFQIEFDALIKSYNRTDSAVSFTPSISLSITTALLTIQSPAQIGDDARTIINYIALSIGAAGSVISGICKLVRDNRKKGLNSRIEIGVRAGYFKFAPAPIIERQLIAPTAPSETTIQQQIVGLRGSLFGR